MATPLMQQIEDAIRLAAELGDDAFDVIEGRGLYHKRLAIKAALSRPELTPDEWCDVLECSTRFDDALAKGHAAVTVLRALASEGEMS